MTDNRTTELRAKLTELGVKWWPMRNNGYYEDRDTEFVINGKKHTAHEWGDGLAVYNLTPEQAIAATLGRPTCEYVIEDNMNESEGMGDVWFRCTNCGTCYDYQADDWLLKMPHCPNCGAKVIQGVDNAD